MQPISTTNLSAAPREPVTNFGDPEGFRCIKLFVEEIAPMFPFVVVAPDTDAEQLAREKPLLYKCVLMVTCQNDVDRQTNLARVIGDEIGRCVGHRERSISILQAVLLYVGWTHIHQHLGAGFLTPMHLAMAMVTELRLDEEAQVNSKISAGALRGIGQTEPPPVRTLEERRAYLGVLWMASIINICFHNMVTPRITKYTEDCCHVLEAAQDHPNDVYLVELIRLLRLVHRVDRVVYQDALDVSSEMTPPLAMVIGALQGEVALPTKFKPSVPAQAVLSRLSQKMVELHLCKLALEDGYFPPESSHTVFRADLLVACLATIDALLDTFCDIADLAVLSLPYGYWGMVGHAIKIYSRLSDVRYGPWSPTASRRHAFGQLAQKMEEANAAGQKARPARRMPEFHEQLVAKLRELGEVQANDTRHKAFQTGDALLDHDMTGGILFDLLDWA
ncbi:hypothetical protein P171DRAFT_372405 [Karstenula rhodostoma CBS 690.94]|uniref:Transcription factor domain-containing protein n=1 Tax=Karstenula rhodostoma CBS 690.94 TaxID=1392251 RepID=A0A9P4U4M3_9PLEO|nr:hypothetical protein P171DRAFT_372405 [Karstenula rhodostoma CBS 690.94]